MQRFFALASVGLLLNERFSFKGHLQVAIWNEMKCDSLIIKPFEFIDRSSNWVASSEWPVDYNLCIAGGIAMKKIEKKFAFLCLICTQRVIQFTSS